VQLGLSFASQRRRKLLKVVLEHRKFRVQTASGNVLIRANEIPTGFSQRITGVCLPARVEQRRLILPRGGRHFPVPNHETSYEWTLEFIDGGGDQGSRLFRGRRSAKEQQTVAWMEEFAPKQRIGIWNLCPQLSHFGHHARDRLAVRSFRKLGS
jgi:hypothetical protein